MTNDVRRCPYYQSESENVKGRWMCVVPKDTIIANSDRGLIIPNNKKDCEVEASSIPRLHGAKLS